MTTDTRKHAIIACLRAFVNQRPGFDPNDYADMPCYRREQRMAQRQRADALQLLRDIELRDSITADAILTEARSGRVTIDPHTTKAGVAGWRVDYCTGQYFCTEFRGAVARLCASVLWTWKRDQCMPEPGAAPVGSGKATAGEYYDGHTKRMVSGGDWLRASFKREYGTLSKRYFS